jgi:hypothetical protein
LLKRKGERERESLRIWGPSADKGETDRFLNTQTFTVRSASYSVCALSRCSDWIRAGRPTGRSSSTGRGKIFVLSTSSRPVLGPTQPPIQRVLRALPPGVKRPGRDADHSPPTSAEVKNAGSIHPLPHTSSWRND